MKLPNPRTFASTGLFGLAAVMIVGGCAAVERQSDQAFFHAEKREHYADVFSAHARAGARSDATLHPVHFTGTELNSLGSAKLELMLPDVESAMPLVVYLNLTGDENEMNLRRTAVSNYLLDAGLASDQFRVELGRNPASWHPSQPHLMRQTKTENPPLGGADSGQGRTLVAPSGIGL